MAPSLRRGCFAVWGPCASRGGMAPAHYFHTRRELWPPDRGASARPARAKAFRVLKAKPEHRVGGINNHIDRAHSRGRPLVDSRLHVFNSRCQRSAQWCLWAVLRLKVGHASVAAPLEPLTDRRAWRLRPVARRSAGPASAAAYLATTLQRLRSHDSSCWLAGELHQYSCQLSGCLAMRVRTLRPSSLRRGPRCRRGQPKRCRRSKP
jgi:hypothetical protein